MAKEFMKGCVAIAEAAVRGGCRFFAGYPITPQNDIPEYLSKRLPEVGGVFIQGESEIASINMVYGAAVTGTRAMTSSSGPGFALKAEGISYLAEANLPAVLVDVTRGGPGLGSIMPSQMDYSFIKAPGHGGFKCITFAPENMQEAVDLIYESFELSEKVNHPVILMPDGIIANMMEAVELPPMKEIGIIENTPDKKWNLGVSKIERRQILALTMDEWGEKKNLASTEKYKLWEETQVRVEEINLADAEIVLVAYGSSARMCKSAMNELAKEGIRIGIIRPITIVPFPKESFNRINYKKVKHVFSIEMSNPGQLVQDVEKYVKDRTSVSHFGRSAGMITTPKEIIELIRKKL